MTLPDAVQPPRPLTWERWHALRGTRGSLMRELMHERVRSVLLSPPVLDVGGGAASAYAGLLTTPGPVVSANLDPAERPTLIADAEGRLPFAEGVFGSVLSLNTLEVLRDDDLALAEMVRVVRPGGWLHLMVPFLYRVHGHPGDYHRHTASGWVAACLEAGIPAREVRVEPLVWDPFSSAWALADSAPLGRNWTRLRRLLRPLVLARPLLFGRIDRRGDAVAADRITGEHALAFYIAARRPDPDGDRPLAEGRER